MESSTRRIAASIVMSTSCLVMSVSSAAPANARQGCSATVFNDDFSLPSIDKSKWYVLTAHRLQGVPPRTGLQSYSDNAVHSGVDGLEIAMTKSDDGDYQSGRIVSKQTFLYGHIEMEAKLPVGRGLWPALWMRTPTNLPLNGEIDLVEGFGSDPSAIQSTLHPWIAGHEDREYCAILAVRPTSTIRRRDCNTLTNMVKLSSDLSQDFHRYAVDWSPDKITWSFDGMQYFTVRREIPRSPMAIIINLAISPLHDGQPDESLRLPLVLRVRNVKVCPLNG